MTDRRPLASRNTKIAARLARGLAERGVAPNRISQASMVFAALGGAAFWRSAYADGAAYGLWLGIAALMCQARLLCNLLDGMVAIEGGRAEPDGQFWNEVPDRVADTLILAGLGLGAGAAALGWAASALAIGTAYVREVGRAQGLAADFCGPMAKPHRMALATAAALVAILLPTLAGLSTLALALWAIAIGSLVTVLRRSRRLIAALRSR